MNYEEALLSERYLEAQSQWPTMDDCYGCLDCRLLFKHPENARCPYCNSESVFDVAAAVNAERAN